MYTWAHWNDICHCLRSQIVNHTDNHTHTQQHLLVSSVYAAVLRGLENNEEIGISLFDNTADEAKCTGIGHGVGHAQCNERHLQ